MKMIVFQMAIIFPKKMIMNENKYDCDLDLPPLTLTTHGAVLNNFDKYAQFDDSNHNDLSWINIEHWPEVGNQ